MEKLTLITGKMVHDNVVGKVVTGMKTEGERLTLTLEGEACPVIEMVIVVEPDSTLCLLVLDDVESPTKSGEVSSSQMTISDVLADMSLDASVESPTISTGVSSSFECVECGCSKAHHTWGYGTGTFYMAACRNCEACDEYVEAS